MSLFRSLRWVALGLVIGTAGAVHAAPPAAALGPENPALSPYKADFVTDIKLASNEQAAGQLQTVVVEIQNAGLVQGTSSVSVRIFLSSTPTPSGSAIAGKTTAAVPGPGETQWLAFSPTVPAGTTPGSYYLCSLLTSGADEITEQNNADCDPLTVTGKTAKPKLERATNRPLRVMRRR